MLGTRFNLIAMPSASARLMKSRMLAFSVMKHLPDRVRAQIIRNIERQDEKRSKRGKLATNRDKLIAARDKESRVLKLETGMRAACGIPFPRNGSRQPAPSPRIQAPMAEPLNFRGDIASRLRARAPDLTTELGECYICHIVGHTTKFCPSKKTRRRQ